MTVEEQIRFMLQVGGSNEVEIDDGDDSDSQNDFLNQLDVGNIPAY